MYDKCVFNKYFMENCLAEEFKWSTMKTLLKAISYVFAKRAAKFKFFNQCYDRAMVVIIRITIKFSCNKFNKIEITL